MTSTITQQQQEAIAAYLNTHHIPAGMGTEEAACSIAAINLSLTGELTDDIPPCMSLVIGKWIIPTQDAMGDAIRNSDRWKSLLPLAAGTGRELEAERLAIIMEWMWGTVLPYLQPTADKRGFGPEWSRMTTERTARASAAAQAAAGRAAAVAAWAAAAAERAVGVERALRAVGVAAAWAASASAQGVAQAWEHFDPCGLLERLQKGTL